MAFLHHRGRPPATDELTAAAQRSKEHVAEALEDLAEADVSSVRVPELGRFLKEVAAIVRGIPTQAWRAAIASLPEEVASDV